MKDLVPALSKYHPHTALYGSLRENFQLCGHKSMQLQVYCCEKEMSYMTIPLLSEAAPAVLRRRI